ncbi:hsp70 family protein [Gigaspora margarita]|uniref:Hsp70 family protein n=1 Tax=Gigaspora margarita TaxID=4874 RepID=A0A8H4ETD1_GIGMA|nr:hsp70 family protein [Gigaspora margarita]
MKESVSNASADTISADNTPNWIDKFKFNHGMIIYKREIGFARRLACKFESQPKFNILSDTSTRVFQMKLMFPTKQKDSFFLTNNINSYAINSDHVSWVLDIDKKPLTDESPVNVFYLEIKCSKAELIFDKESMKLSESLIKAVTSALEDNNPYHELTKIFQKYGHFLPRKVVLGYKLYRMAYLIVDEKCLKQNDEKIEWETLNDFNDKCNDVLNILNLWEKNDNDSLQIINWSELYPIYDIFDESLCKDIKCILRINDTKSYVNEKVLKAGVIPIEELRDFYFVEFSSTLKSNNYRIFGKLMTKDGEPKDEMVVKFKFTDINGFYVVIVNFDSIKAKDYVNLQITWILIGKPAEIGIFDKNTRNIAIICSENTSFTFQNGREDLIAQLKVPENLSTNSILITSIEYPRSNYGPNIITSIKNYRNNEIEINIYDLNSHRTCPLEINL